MNEQRRMQYLEELGIEMFVPRWILPAAKASVQALLPEPSPAETPSAVAVSAAATVLSVASVAPVAVMSEPQVRPERTEPQAVSGLVSGIIGELGGKSAEADKPRTASRPPQEAGTEAQAVHFSLSIWPVNANLMVLDSRHAREALPTQALLRNIVFAKGFSEPLTKPEVLNWPLFAAVEYTGGWDEAGEMVRAFLKARLELQPVQTLWVMGMDAYGALFGETASYEGKVGSVLDIPELATLGVVLPSLTDVLKQPQLKAKVWSTIRALNV